MIFFLVEYFFQVLKNRIKPSQEQSSALWISANKIFFHGTEAAVCNRPVKLNQTLISYFHVSNVLTQFAMCTSINSPTFAVYVRTHKAKFM